MSFTPAPAGPEAVDTGAVIPEGPASKLGKLAAAALAIAALVAAVLNGDHTPETLVALGGAVATLVTYMGGRYAQAAALLRDAPSPARPVAVGGVALSGELVEPPAPVVVNVGPPASSSSDAPPAPDLDDSVHALTDGDPAEPAGGEPIVETDSAPDPDVEDDAR